MQTRTHTTPGVSFLGVELVPYRTERRVILSKAERATLTAARAILEELRKRTELALLAQPWASGEDGADLYASEQRGRDVILAAALLEELTADPIAAVID